MTRELLIEKLQGGNPTKEQLVSWIQHLPCAVDKRKPIRYRIGDCLMHPIFRHPYILLEKKGDLWVCGLLTSESDCSEILEPCRSRFYDNSYFTRVLFTITKIQGSWMNPYDNPEHLRKVRTRLKAVFLQ